MEMSKLLKQSHLFTALNIKYDNNKTGSYWMQQPDGKQIIFLLRFFFFWKGKDVLDLSNITARSFTFPLHSYSRGKETTTHK